MSVFTLEELQKMNKNELITIIGNYISDQEIWLNKVAGLEKQIDDKNAEIEQLKKRHGVALLRNDDLDLENYELKKQVDELTEEKQQLFQANVDTQEQLNTLRLEKKRENAELQKQVDELKAKFPNNCVVLSKEEWNKLMGDTYTSKELDEIVAYKERVKAREVARDILTKLADDFDVAGMDVEYPLNRVKIYAKEYGVEME